MASLTWLWLEERTMTLLESRYFSSGLPRDIKFMREGEAVSLRTSMISHSSAGRRQFIFSIDIEANGSPVEHLSSATDGETISVYCVNKAGEVIEFQSGQLPKAEELDSMIKKGKLGELFRVPDGFLDYFVDCRHYFPEVSGISGPSTLQTSGDQGTVDIDVARDIVPFKDDNGRAVALLCALSPIATGACIVAVAIILFAPELH